jgi:predicted HTH domain antitoxin
LAVLTVGGVGSCEKPFFFWQAVRVNLELPEIENSELTPADLRLELACALYARGKITAITGSHLAGLDLISFHGALKERGIPRNYTIQDFHDDMDALKKLFPA